MHENGAVMRAELREAVERALALADTLKLHSVGIGLDAAKIALGSPMEADEERLRKLVEVGSARAGRSERRRAEERVEASRPLSSGSRR